MTLQGTRRGRLGALRAPRRQGQQAPPPRTSSHELQTRGSRVPLL